MSLMARLLPPRSYCAGCGRPFYSDKRRPCRCGETARLFSRSAQDGMHTADKAG
ncbi:MAG: hypothetical protein ABIS21_01040 [Acidimicrobiales bacterium]